MSPRTGNEHPAFSEFALDIIGNVLMRAADPGELGDYLTQEMRELTGARLVIIFECRHNEHDGEHRLTAVTPERRRSLAESSGIGRLAGVCHDLEQATLWHHEAGAGEAEATLSSLGFGLSMGVPLRIGERRVGFMLLLGLPDRRRMESVLHALDLLSTIVALVLRNSLLYDQQEAIIRERTRVARESEERFRTLARVAPVGILHTDAQGRCSFVNDYWCEMAGIGPEEVRRKGWPSALHPDDRARVLDEWLEATKAGLPFASEYRFRHPDGTTVWASGQALAETDDDGRVTGHVTAVQDITSFKRTERALARYRDRLEDLVEDRTEELERSRQELRRSERLASVGTLAAGMAHQINNPLGAMLSSAEFALVCESDPDSRAVWKRALEETIEQTKRCGRIVRSILQFSREEPTEKWSEDVTEVVRRALQLSRGYARERSAVVEFDPCREPCFVAINPIEMEQALVNLIRNALESRTEGVRVEIRTHRSSESAFIEVRDDGRGIEPGSLERVFDPFYTTRLIEGGTGLGLSVAHGIVTDHGGQIHVESEPGRGTLVTIELPLCEAG